LRAKQARRQRKQHRRRHGKRILERATRFSTAAMDGLSTDAATGGSEDMPREFLGVESSRICESHVDGISAVSRGHAGRDVEDLPGDLTMPSLSRNPAASSRSEPGVRITMAILCPSTRISSGSSLASTSVAFAEAAAIFVADDFNGRDVGHGCAAD
jgi:hypothetical protein